jgi:hypothetical protein
MLESNAGAFASASHRRQSSDGTAASPWARRSRTQHDPVRHIHESARSDSEFRQRVFASARRPVDPDLYAHVFEQPEQDAEGQPFTVGEDGGVYMSPDALDKDGFFQPSTPEEFEAMLRFVPRRAESTTSCPTAASPLTARICAWRVTRPARRLGRQSSS